MLVLQIVNEMASAAGLPCDIDPALCAALRSQKTGDYSLHVYQLFTGLFTCERK